ncbi:hypothetical protein [Leptolyngbya sp. FACHB-16]|uniref:hypothetical protein n=2 Tax=unclassified Leptolyngbya TaxID=2650499 RepID=UPI001681EABF|nr:hypothetical protein [Leptolyngbya sp. FACHB-16]MBD2156881.1 hypothetical protein [Leptolyngbya sp. FACHB-16]
MSPEEKKRRVVGKVSHSMLATRDGFLVAAEGSLVNETEADIAEVSGLLDNLYRATHYSSGRSRPFNPMDEF